MQPSGTSMLADLVEGGEGLDHTTGGHSHFESKRDAELACFRLAKQVGAVKLRRQLPRIEVFPDMR